MKRMLATVCLVGLALVIAVPAVDAKKEAVEAAAKAWEDAATKRDPGAIAATYAEDAVLLPPNSDFVRGREAIKAEWKAMLDMGLKLVVEAGAEIQVDGSMAYRMGKYRVLGPDGIELDYGKYIEIWKKVGKNWVIIRDMWNTSMPLPEPEPH